jgi:hypothetical protein
MYRRFFIRKTEGKNQHGFHRLERTMMGMAGRTEGTDVKAVKRFSLMSWCGTPWVISICYGMYSG